jgi:DUF971 family protein
MTTGVKPTALIREGDGLRIDWSDQQSTYVSWRTLRKHCPCASCQMERSQPPNPFKILSAAEIAAGAPRPVAMKPVGHYAYQIIWNDGHSTGIYPLTTLRSLNEPR